MKHICSIYTYISSESTIHETKHSVYMNFDKGRNLISGDKVVFNLLSVLFRAAGWHSIIFVKLVSKLMAKIYNKLWLALFAFSAFLLHSRFVVNFALLSYFLFPKFRPSSWAASEQLIDGREAAKEQSLNFGAFCSLSGGFFFRVWWRECGVLIRIYIHMHAICIIR